MMERFSIRFRIKCLAVVVLFLIVAAGSVGAPGLTITGKVVDSAGQPLPDTTVIVYHAGVLNGYSTFCPSCYKDCGKRTKTDESGLYTINKLEPGLWFDLLIVQGGYAPEVIKVKDISTGKAPIVTLKVRPSATNSSQAVKGHVVDPKGNPVPDALVTSVGIESDRGSTIGTIPGLDPLAVTDRNGDFELVYAETTKRMLVSIEARTLALKFAVLVTGQRRQTIELLRGATVKGRLMKDGKPVRGAEIGLIGHERGGFGAGLTILGDPYPEMRVGTQENGTFVISDVPTRVQWYLYAKMESVTGRGASETKVCMTPRPGGTVDVGDIQLRPGYSLEGKVVLSDGKPVPGGMRVIISSQRVWDNQTVVLDKDGLFRFLNLPEDTYSISPAVRGYSLPDNQYELRISVQRDVDSFVVSLNPEQPKH